MKKKALLYPYSIDNYQIAKYSELLEKYEIIGVKMDKHKCVQQQNISYVYWEDYLEINFDEMKMEQYDVVIVGEDESLDQDKEELVFKFIEANADNNKDIVVLYGLNENQYSRMYNICKDRNVKLEIYSGMNMPTDKLLLNNESLYRIDTPIILVAGITERVNKFDVQLTIRKHFKEKGYKVSQIGTKNFSELFGFYSFPKFMFQDLSASKKILYFNAFCKSIEYGEKPDVIIIGVPGSLIPYNDTFTNKFGTTAFEIGNAVDADAIVMNLNYEVYNREYFDKIETLVENRLGDEILCYVLSNNQIDTYRSYEEKKMTYVTVDEKKNNEMIEKYDDMQVKPIYSIINKNAMKELSEYVEQALLSEEARLL